MNIFRFLICALLFFSGCKNKEEIIFTGYTPLDSAKSIQFDTLKVNPIFMNREYYGGIFDTNYYWDIYEINHDRKIFLKSSSQASSVTDNFADSLFIDKWKFSIFKLFNDKIIRFRIVQILEFKFLDLKYLLFVGKDKDEGGNNIFNSKILLARIQSDSVIVFCPPLKLDYGQSNAQSFLSNYFCDLNHDQYLDFLEWTQNDTIEVYSLINDDFVHQPEFIKLYRKDIPDEKLYIDQKHSNWPYPYFKSLNRFPNSPIFDFQPAYY